ncbi:MAG: hypothetical protein LBH92_08900 [Bacteroidales bacterium]|jgi:hypothetical protein|nr:hypothetical protein [Bacteroidales bacterium]
MELKKIRLRELRNYCESEEFRNFSVKPISSLRAVSYENNPRADQDDVVLYLFVENGVLLAFSLVFADAIIEPNKLIRFGWGSGLWTNPDFRGNKLWKALLDEEIKDWDGKIMFTNYAPLLQRIYCGSGAFSLFAERNGYRFYLYPNFKALLKERNFYGKIKIFLPLMNFAARSGSIFKKLFYSNPKFQYEEISIPDRECWNFVEELNLHSTFNRRDREMQWIVKYPWVRADEDAENIFPFSYTGKTYKLVTFKIYESGQFTGFIVSSLVNGHLKILYYYCSIDNLKDIADLISFVAIQNHIQYLTILDAPLSQAVKLSKNAFVFSKKYSSHVYATFDYAADKKIFDGDGDNCFT